MKSEWIGDYEGNQMKITNSWFTGEKLFVNSELQDDRLSFISISSNLSGSVSNKNGEKQEIKVNIGGCLKVSCRLFMDNKKVEVQQTK
jgi:hypothetical protein